MRVYARSCIVDRIEKDIAQEFIVKHHRHGASNGSFAKESIGLFYKGELVAVAQFCSPRTPAKKKVYSVELLRLAFHRDYRVVGGASKLIKHYIDKYNPSDIFTYQDSTGENTSVYENCGFTLVSIKKSKKYLVKNGKTVHTAIRENKEIFTISSVVQYGIDSLLKTSIGEQFHEDGSRKTNVELFEENGFHIESTTGDKTYEWFNPNITFYTYKITATDSNKYYYGVSHVKKGDASKEDCLNNGYFGSGGKGIKNNKFANWKNKHKDFLVKEVVKTFSNKQEAYRHEKDLIGDSYKTDPLCLNSMSGGINTRFNKGWRENVTIRECPKHGLVKHRGNACYSCFMNDLVSERECPKHGLTKHQGNSCPRCAVEKSFYIGHCDTHGETKFTGYSCRACSVAATVKTKECKKHGLTKFQGDVCSTCNAESTISLRNCNKHGNTKHIGDRCRKCISDGSFTDRYCVYHGLTKHNGKSCTRCAALKKKHNKDHNQSAPDHDCHFCFELKTEEV